MNTYKNTGEVLDFEEYVRTRQDALLRSARRLVGDPLEAQDLLQTARPDGMGWCGVRVAAGLAAHPHHDHRVQIANAKCAFHYVSPILL
ncbi:hypothetical protein [Streptomyces sp. SLBN-8D4]|uniref:hypothetical protein n=1 Tax=Streptomyces sp. SLBN-8D4 TaxID=3377728 RepID=UPI003C7CDB89